LNPIGAVSIFAEISPSGRVRARTKASTNCAGAAIARLRPSFSRDVAQAGTRGSVVRVVDDHAARAGDAEGVEDSLKPVSRECIRSGVMGGSFSLRLWTERDDGR
jgi:hypothetical protein